MIIKLFKREYNIEFPNYSNYKSYWLLKNKSWGSFKYYFFPSIFRMETKEELSRKVNKNKFFSSKCV